MKRQRNMSQMKQQNKTSEKELNKMETSNLLDAEFKTMVIRIFNEFSETTNSVKKDQSEMKDTLTGMKNNSQKINSREDGPGDKSVIWNIRKKKTIKIARRKRIPPKLG